MFRDLLLEARPVFRRLSRRKGRTAVVIATLSIALGATLAIARIADPVLVRPLPYHDSERLWMFQSLHEMPDGREEEVAAGPLDFGRWRSDNSSFEQVEAIWPRSIAVTGMGDPLYVEGASISSGLFDMLGVEPILGRQLRPEEEPPGSNLCIISYGFWSSRFDRSPSVVGRTIGLDGAPFTIVGVMPRGFHFVHGDIRIWTTLGLDLTQGGPNRFLTVLGRSKRDATPTTLQSDIQRISAALERESPELYKGWKVKVRSLRDFMYGSRRLVLILLSMAVAGLLAIACVNLANLSMSRIEEERDEYAMRSALGSSRGRVITGVAVESILSGVLGGVGGLILSIWLVRGLLQFDPQLAASLGPLRIDLRVALMVVAGSVLVALMIAVLPAIRAVRITPLNPAARGVAGSRRGTRTAQNLLILQVAMATLLLVVGGMLLRNLRERMNVDTKLDTSKILTFQLRLTSARYSDSEERQMFAERMLERLEALPGVESAGVTINVFDEDFDFITTFRVEGDQPDKPANTSRFRRATPHYFETMGISVIEGRGVLSSDTPDATPVAVVSRSFAEAFWPGLSPIGRHLTRTAPGSKETTVVGVVEDVWDLGYVGGPSPTLYLPYSQSPSRFVSGVVRAKGDPASLASSIPGLIRSIDADQPVEKVVPLDEALSRSVYADILRSIVTTGLGIAGLLVAAIGIYATISWSTTRRTREIGVKMAFGADRTRVFAMVMLESGRLVATGLLTGLTLSWVAARAVRGVIEITHSFDPLVTVTVILVTVAVAACSTLLPAWRISRLDPVRALRDDL